jgi:O-acetyl-ADP-ribose deacetylase (regulator of RNase III)
MASPRNENPLLPSTPGETDGVVFGRTTLQAVAGTVLDIPADAVVCPANRRGVMGVGVAGAVRLAGGVEIEREAMAAAPLAVGTAIATGSGKLAARGIKTIIHAVVADALGAPTQPEIVRRAMSEALRLADRHRARTLVLPPLGAGLGSGRLSTDAVAALTIEETLAHLRRFTSRLDRIVLVARSDEEADDLCALLREARDYWWSIKP